MKKNIIIMIAVVLLVLAMKNNKKKIEKINRSLELSREKIENLKKVDSDESEKLNQLFLKSFFNYDSMLEKYNNLLPIMSEESLTFIFPNGDELLESNYLSRIAFKEAYKNTITNDEVVFLNNVIINIVVDGFEMNEKHFLKTTLIFDNGSWIVDKVEYLK